MTILSKASLFSALLLLAGVASAEDYTDYILWFQVNENATVTKTWEDEFGQEQSTTTSAGAYLSDDGNAVNAARVYATDGTTEAYLNIGFLDVDQATGRTTFSYVQGSGITPKIAPIATVLDDDGDPAGWGTGATLGSLLTGESAEMAQNVGFNEFRFAVELGYVNGNDWTTLAVSDEHTYQQVQQYIASVSESIAGFGNLPWTPINYTAVPEPSAGLLLLFGAGLFGLRRPRRDRGDIRQSTTDNRNECRLSVVDCHASWESAPAPRYAALRPRQAQPSRIVARAGGAATFADRQSLIATVVGCRMSRAATFQYFPPEKLAPGKNSSKMQSADRDDVGWSRKKMKENIFSLRFDAIVALVCLSLSVFAADPSRDCLVRFSSPGPDRYADGTLVKDGECYALVWSPAGASFAGFNADGTPVSADDRVVLAGALALGGRCRDSVFQIPAAEYEALKGGEWAVCLVDTRTVAGAPAGVQDGKPRRVNRWGVVSDGVEIAGAGTISRQLASVGTRSVASAVRATNLSAVPPNLMPPQITAIELTDGEVWLAVDGTVPYLDYTIISGEKPNDLKPDYFSEVVEGDDRSEIAIGTIQSAKRRFFKVKRAE